MQNTLLCVDDETSILKSLRRIFRNEDFKVITAESAKEAIEILENESINAILSDYKMPGMTGTELLTFVKDNYPDTLRLLLTGEADKEALIEAINNGAVYKFLSKPWDNVELKKIISECFKIFNLEKENKKLTDELKFSNKKLEKLNNELGLRVEEKTEELIKAKFYDESTGLPNRLMLLERLTYSIKRSKREDFSSAVIVLGIHNLNKVSQSLKFDDSTQILRMLVNQLSIETRESEPIYRISDDAICFLAESKKKTDELSLFAKRLLATAKKPLTIEGGEVYLKGCIGISIYPEDGFNAALLLQNAEYAMQHARENQADSYQYFSKDLNAKAKKRLALEADLHHAVQNGEFFLHYQPRVCAETSTLIGAEALLRWKHPERGIVPPGIFVPVLEEIGLIEIVGEWILTEVYSVIEKWIENNVSPIRISVNLSPEQFNNSALDNVLTLLSKKQHIVEHLEFEITESTLMKNADEARLILEKIHKLGIKIAIDDFGTGYSSLSYITQFPFDHLKIDRSFVIDLGNDRDTNAVVRTIVTLAQSLKMRTVAEGIETETQARALNVLGCDEFQGYLFGKPNSQQALEKLMENGISVDNAQTDSTKEAI